MSQEELKISKISLKCGNDNSVDVKLLPCNVITDQDLIKSNELEHLYPSPVEIINDNKEAIYLRGRKLIGSEIKINNQNGFITEVDGDNNIQCERKVNKLYNYEREGNESRQVKEEINFKEYFDLINTIMK